MALPSFGQTSISGEIVDSLTNKRIAFATVALIKENIGTNTNEVGFFKITSQYFNDSIIISSVGYNSKNLSVHSTTDNMTIMLQPKFVALDTVQIYSKLNWSYYGINDFSNCGESSYTSNGQVYQIAEHFKIPTLNAWLSEIHICKSADRAIFRVRIYSRDSITGKPSYELTDSLILVRSRKKHVRIDLEKYHIFVPNNDFFVGIEWIKIPENENKMFIKSQKNTLVIYQPFISCTNDPMRLTDKRGAWYLNYKNEWHQLPGMPRSFLISAKIKY
jgi:hypothetical protein